MPTVREERESGEGPIYFYDPAIVPKPPVVLQGFRFVQKDKNMDVIFASAHDLDRLCKVPFIENDLPNHDVAASLAAGGGGRWQRKSSDQRIDDIAQFWDQADNNYMANGAVISLPDEPAYTVAAAGMAVAYNIEVDWVVVECPSCGWAPPAGSPRDGWEFDSCADCDWSGRPGAIIDGQHRIRGCAKSVAQRGEGLIATLLHPTMVTGFAAAEQAKIFTEITTGAKPLDPHHQIALLRLFSLKGGKSIKSLRNPDFRLLPAAVPPAVNTIGDRNNRAFEIALDLNNGGMATAPWNNAGGRLTMIRYSGGKEGRQRPGDVLEADDFIQIMSRWLDAGGVLSDATQADGMMTRVASRNALSHYFSAIIATWPGAAHWNAVRPPGGANGYLQQRGIFEVLFKLFGVISARMRANGIAYNLANYRNQLSYLSNLLWPTWEIWGRPDMNKNLMFNSIQHFYAHLDTLGIPDPSTTSPPTVLAPAINGWTGATPDPIAAIAITDDAGGPHPPTWYATNPVGAPKLRFDWSGGCTNTITGLVTDKPINSYQDSAVVTVTQDDAGGVPQTLYQSNGKFNPTSIDLSWSDLTHPVRGAAGGGLIEVSVVYRNHVGPMTVPVAALPPG